MVTEADTCRMLVLPALYAAGWTDAQIREQYTFAPGRIIITGSAVRRGRRKRADYLLSFADQAIAVVEAKSEDHLASTGLQQAKEYAEILGLRFAYSTNGHSIVEHDYTTGRDNELTAYPSPDELWRRDCAARGVDPDSSVTRATYFLAGSAAPRYYQDISIQRAVDAITKGQRRLLLTLATGTGKTVVAFQVCWRLWSSGWNTTGEFRKPRMLYLADRNVLIDDPKDKTFAPFGEARHKIIGGDTRRSREMYFATYQALAHDETRPAAYRDFPPDFFDLIVVDECHRGSARDQSNWREILEYFRPAAQLGMTATPLRADNRDTYRYFRNPLYTYSLRSGIRDGFLAPYRVHRVVTTVDATGWRPARGELDRYGREIPDQEYTTHDFDRAVALRERTRAIARHLSAFLERTDPFAKTIVFCVDQEHAEDMRLALNNYNAERVRRYPDYVARVTADEGAVGGGHLSRFQELEAVTPTILTTSQLLTTGVDAPTCKNVVIARVIGSMTEFKQIIGRGTRVREDYGKLFFNIIDYTGSATRLFADPEFDGEPALIDEETIDEDGDVVDATVIEPEKEADPDEIEVTLFDVDDSPSETSSRKFYYDGGSVQIAAEVVYELDAEGRQLRVVSYSEYARQGVRSLIADQAALREQWQDHRKRAELLNALGERGIELPRLAEQAGLRDADPLDLLCHVAFSAPPRTRRDRAKHAAQQTEFFDKYRPEARAILAELLEKYAEYGPDQLKLPDVLKVPPLSSHGNPLEIAAVFGGPHQLREAVEALEELLYAA